MAREAGFCRFEGISCRTDGPSLVEDDVPLVDADDVPLVDAEESSFSFCLPCRLNKPSFSWR